jgi:hypothetical protein
MLAGWGLSLTPEILNRALRNGTATTSPAVASLCLLAGAAQAPSSKAPVQPCYDSKGAGPGLQPVAGHITTAVRLAPLLERRWAVGGYGGAKGPCVEAP